MGNLSSEKTQLCHKLLVPFLLWLHVEIRSPNRNVSFLSTLILFFTFYLSVLSLRKLIPDVKVLRDFNEQYQIPSIFFFKNNNEKKKKKQYTLNNYTSSFRFKDSDLNP